VLRAVQLMQQVNRKYGKGVIEDYEQIYHHLEDPENLKLSPRQDEILDDTVLPIMEVNDQLASELKGQEVPLENYVHRVVKGKGGWLDRILAGWLST